jgi:hypothetical protein
MHVSAVFVHLSVTLVPSEICEDIVEHATYSYKDKYQDKCLKKQQPIQSLIQKQW